MACARALGRVRAERRATSARRPRPTDSTTTTADGCSTPAMARRARAGGRRRRVQLALQRNDEPLRGAGLRTCWALSSDMCRSAVGGSLGAFTEYARNPAFGALVGCASWSVASCKRARGGAARGTMTTQVVRVQPARAARARGRRRRRRRAGRRRRAAREFLWTRLGSGAPPAPAGGSCECLAMSGADSRRYNCACGVHVRVGDFTPRPAFRHPGRRRRREFRGPTSCCLGVNGWRSVRALPDRPSFAGSDLEALSDRRRARIRVLLYSARFGSLRRHGARAKHQLVRF